MPYMRPVTRFPYGLSLEARHLAALKGVRHSVSMTAKAAKVLKCEDTALL